MSQASPPSNSLTSAHDTLPSGSSPKVVSTLRRGKWTVEEETYVARVIQDFNSGFLNAPAGTTLRSYLSEKLQCDPMRITKKFTGEACIGKRVFHPAVRSTANTAAIDKAQVSSRCAESHCFLIRMLIGFAASLRRLNSMPWNGGGEDVLRCNSVSQPRKRRHRPLRQVPLMVLIERIL